MVQPRDISLAPPLHRYCDSLGDLNVMQTKAACLLRDNLLSIMEGPPGTGKTATLASAAIAWFRSAKSPVLICTYSHTAAETVLRRLITLAPRLGLGTQHLAHLRDFESGPSDLWSYHVFTTAGLDEALSNKKGKKNHHILNRVIDGSDGGHTGIVATSAYWSDYLRTRIPRSEPDWLLRFGLVLIDEASQATESQATVALRWALDGARVGLWGDSRQLGPHRRDGMRAPSSWTEAADSLMAHLARRLGDSSHARLVRTSCYIS